MFNTRSFGKEIIDDFHFSGDEMQHNLRELDLINNYLGGYNSIIKALLKLSNKHPSKLKLMDVGCGSAKLLTDIELRINNIELTGVDANENIIAYAQSKLNKKSSINLLHEDCFNINLYEIHKPDVVVLSLFLHHFSTSEIVRLLNIFKHANVKYVIINDLHRNVAAYYGFQLISILFNFSRVTKHDGKLSILKGFTKNEWIEILKHVKVNTFDISWKWAFRHIITIKF